MINKEEIEAIDFTRYLVNDYKRQLELLKKNGCENFGYEKDEIDIIEYRNRQFERLLNLTDKQENKIKELEEINAEHQKLNGELQKKVTQLEIENNNLLKIQETKGVYVTREVAPYIKKLNELEIKTDNLICENKKLQEIIDGKTIQELGVSDLYKED